MNRCPNPLFERWLEEWSVEAASRNSKLQPAFARALHSLRKYPIELKSGRDCLILQNFGVNLCKKLDRKLAEYKENHWEFTRRNRQLLNVSHRQNEQHKDIATLKTCNFTLNSDYSSKFTSNETGINSSEKLCKIYSEINVDSVSFLPVEQFSSHSSEMDGKYTTSLEVVDDFPFTLKPTKQNHLDFMEIADDVENFIQKANLDNNKHSALNDVGSKRFRLSQNCLTNECDLHATFEQLVFLPEEFEIVLLIDTQENSIKTNQFMNKDTLKNVFNSKVKYEVRHLNLGDYTWIARNNRNEELILPYIVERKRMDDLAGSIKDGRFHEQKFRLRQCGIHNVIFLVENFVKRTGFGLPTVTLHQAIVNTQVVDEFFIKFTSDHEHSMMYLWTLTNLLTKIFKKKTLLSCSKDNVPTLNIEDDIISLLTYQEFSQFSVKNKVLKPREMFIKHLIQLNNLSLEKAFVITEWYPTPRHLIAAFKSSEKPELLLSTIRYGSLQRNIGPRISKTIYRLYTCPELK